MRDRVHEHTCCAPHQGKRNTPLQVASDIEAAEIASYQLMERLAAPNTLFMFMRREGRTERRSQEAWAKRRATFGLVAKLTIIMHWVEKTSNR